MKPKIDAIIIDGAVLVQMNHPESSLKTCCNYCEVQLVNKSSIVTKGFGTIFFKKTNKKTKSGKINKTQYKA